MNIFNTESLNTILSDFINLNCSEEYPNWNYECFACRVSEIESKDRDGFIAFTNGGIDITWLSLLDLARGSGSYPAVMMPELVRQEESCLHGYKIDYPEHFSDDDELLAEYDEHFSKYESEWFSEGGLFAYQLRIIKYNADNCRNESGQDEYFICAGINLDYEYIRDKGLNLTYSRTVTVEELETNPELFETILNDAAGSI